MISFCFPLLKSFTLVLLISMHPVESRTLTKAVAPGWPRLQSESTRRQVNGDQLEPVLPELSFKEYLLRSRQQERRKSERNVAPQTSNRLRRNRPGRSRRPQATRRRFKEAKPDSSPSEVFVEDINVLKANVKPKLLSPRFNAQPIQIVGRPQLLNADIKPKLLSPNLDHQLIGMKIYPELLGLDVRPKLLSPKVKTRLIGARVSFHFSMILRIAQTFL